jgi:hypothetical protein
MRILLLRRLTGAIERLNLKVGKLCGHGLAAMLAREKLSSAYQSEYQRDYQENDRHPEQEARSFHRRTGHAAEAQKSRDKCNHEENNGPVQQIAHYPPPKR